MKCLYTGKYWRYNNRIKTNPEIRRDDSLNNANGNILRRMLPKEMYRSSIEILTAYLQSVPCMVNRTKEAVKKAYLGWLEKAGNVTKSRYHYAKVAEVLKEYGQYFGEEEAHWLAANLQQKYPIRKLLREALQEAKLIW